MMSCVPSGCGSSRNSLAPAFSSRACSAFALAATTAARGRTVPLLRSLREADWKKAGRHTESGPYTADDWLRIYAAHLEGHASQIERNLAAWAARG